jgi:hypothetical protein
MKKEFGSFAEFYPGYLDEHRDPMCRRLHVVGSLLVIATLVAALALGRWLLLLAVPVVGYGFAWIGHFAFERNRPATFDHPIYSLAADWVMLKDVLTGRLPW